MAEADFVSAILPLLQDNAVDVVEWSFDTFFAAEEPSWLKDLLNFMQEMGVCLGMAFIIPYLMQDGRSDRKCGFKS